MGIQSAIVVEQSAERRARLKEVLRSSGVFADISFAATLREVEEFFRSEKDFDICILSHQLGASTAAGFVHHMKLNFGASPCAYIMLLPDNVDSGLMAVFLLQGVDAFLVEPYSVESVIRATGLAAKLAKNSAQARSEAALRIFVEELLGQLGTLAGLRRQGRKAAITRTVFYEMCSELKNFSSDLRDKYYSMLLRVAAERDAAIDLGTPLSAAAAERNRIAIRRLAG